MRHPIGGPTLWILLATLTLSPAGRSLAAEPPGDARGDSRDLVQQINVAYERGEYQRAALLLEQAYEADPQPYYLYSKGEALLADKDYEAALGAFQRFLATDPPAVDAAAARERVAQCEEQMPPPPLLPSSPPSPVAAALLVETTPPPDLPPYEPLRRDGLFIGLLTGGAVVSATGAGLVVGARLAIDRTEDPTTEDDWERSIGRSRTLATAGTVVLGIGGAVLVTAAIRAVMVSRGRRPRALSWR